MPPRRTTRPPTRPLPPPRRVITAGGGWPAQRQVTPRQAAAGTLRGARAVTRPRRPGYGQILMAELVAGAVITGIRAVADYQPQADGTVKGKIGHPQGQYGPLPVLAGLITVFFILSFVAAGGGTRARVAVIFGGLIDLVLAMKSLNEFNAVAGTYATFGKAKIPPGKWQTTGTAAGEPVTGTVSSASSSSGGNPRNLSQLNQQLSNLLNTGPQIPGFRQWWTRQEAAIASWLKSHLG